MNDEFYIGWEAKAPPGIRGTVHKAVSFLLAFALLAAVVLATAQRTIGVSAFEWGTLKDFSGIMQGRPYPHLLVPRPGADAGQVSFSTYYLVKPFKFGLDPEIAARFDGKPVTLRGTLIYRGNQTMIEALPDSVKPANGPAPDLAKAASIRPVDLGRQTLVGEIVDSKCYLGVMNPGQLAPHRACAIRCISGGIPPGFLVRHTGGAALYFLLVSAEGKPVNQQVLGLVAEPVEITGNVSRQGDLLVLRADPASYRPAQK